MTNRDVRNCGGCGNSCVDGWCDAGTCKDVSTTQLVSGLSKLGDLVVDGGELYFTDVGTYTVNAVPTSGGTPVAIAVGQAQPERLAADGTSIYWTNELGNAVMWSPLSNPSPQLLATESQPWGIAIGASYVYWTSKTNGTVMRIPKTGGTPELVWQNTGDKPGEITIASGNVFWSTAAGAILEEAVNGSSAKTIVPAAKAATALQIAADSGDVCIAGSNGTHCVHSLDGWRWADGISTGSETQGVAIAGGHVVSTYFATNWPGQGSGVSVRGLYSNATFWIFWYQGNQPLYGRVAVDGTSVYFGAQTWIGKVPLPP